MKNLFLYTIFFFLLLGMRANAQDPSILAAASPGWSLLASPPKGNFDTLKIPLKRADNLLLIEAEVDGVRGNFIYDTGAPGLVLNTAYYRQQAIKKNRSSVGVAGSSTEVFETQVKQLRIKELYFENILVELTELSHIENNKGVKILGLLGNALFEEFIVKIDLRKSVMYVIKPNKITSKEISTVNNISLNLSYINNTIFIPMKIDGKNINVCFDTGAELMVIDNYLPKSVMKNVQLTKRLNLRGTGGQKIEVWSGKLSKLQLQKYNFPETPIIISSLQQLSEAYGQPLDAIIGYNLLEKGIVEINVRKKQFRLYLYEENNNE